MPNPAPIHVLRPQPARRLLAFGMQAMLGGLLLSVALASPPESLGWRVFLVLAGLAALWLGVRGWSGGTTGIVLHEGGLSTEDGRPIALVEDIARVDRGTFAFKPSNGFALRLRRSMPPAWTPGMWWRLGRRVGVGGVTGGAEGRAVADALAAMVRARDGGG